MRQSTSPTVPESPTPGDPAPSKNSPWKQLKSKRISYLTLPLLIMATVAEFVIVATGFKYQQMVCVPEGMGVLFLGIGPIGATILAVELLKLPLAIWTASRTGFTKAFMLFIGLPLICLLTFQLVKDMAVYEMTTAMRPATEYLEKANAEEIRINKLEGELGAIKEKKKAGEAEKSDVDAAVAICWTSKPSCHRRSQPRSQPRAALCRAVRRWTRSSTYASGAASFSRAAKSMAASPASSIASPASSMAFLVA